MEYESSYQTKEKPNNEALTYGIEAYSLVNPVYAKIVFKVNGVGNLTLECTPSLTPGVKPAGLENGRVPAGAHIFAYDKKIIYSITFDDCVAVSEMAKRRFDWDSTTNSPVNLATIKPVMLYRNSSKFSKKLTIQYVDGGNSDYYVNMNFECTDDNGITNKFKLPMNLEKFDLFAKLLESYQNSYFMIQYYNQIEKSKDEKLAAIVKKLG